MAKKGDDTSRSAKRLRRLGERTASLRRELDRINHKRRRLDERVARMEVALVEIEGRYAALLTPAGSDTDADSGPDASWTVVQLREEARRRDLPGLSRLSKADLLAALT